MNTLELLLRLVIAAICGACIGIDRERRGKGAGVRTHLIVSLTAALMMIISKYGFYDIVKLMFDVKEIIKLDPSRVASGIVTAIGFLGAGLIVVNSRSITGLTTAAGIWATVGVGMSIGAGMYSVGLFCVALLLIVNLLLYKLMSERHTGQIEFTIKEPGTSVEDIIRILNQHRFEQGHIQVAVQTDGVSCYTIDFRLNRQITVKEIEQILSDHVNLKHLVLF